MYLKYIGKFDAFNAKAKRYISILELMISILDHGFNCRLRFVSLNITK